MTDKPSATSAILLCAREIVADGTAFALRQVIRCSMREHPELPAEMHLRIAREAIMLAMSDSLDLMLEEEAESEWTRDYETRAQ